jgi:hypothetical protein
MYAIYGSVCSLTHRYGPVVDKEKIGNPTEALQSFVFVRADWFIHEIPACGDYREP